MVNVLFYFRLFTLLRFVDLWRAFREARPNRPRQGRPKNGATLYVSIAITSPLALEMDALPWWEILSSHLSPEKFAGSFKKNAKKGLSRW
jgi:hypothetical protein